MNEILMTIKVRAAHYLVREYPIYWASTDMNEQILLRPITMEGFLELDNNMICSTSRGKREIETEPRTVSEDISQCCGKLSLYTTISSIQHLLPSE